MTSETPDDLYYLETHEWARVENGTARVGISDFAQDELGDIVFVELPASNETIEQEAAFGVIESIKAVSDLYAPLSGTIASVNTELEDRPELVNDDPYGDGWLIEIEIADVGEVDALLSPAEYADQIN